LERDFKGKSKEHEEHIGRIYEILEVLMEPPPTEKKRIGFTGKRTQESADGTDEHRCVADLHDREL
jgi:hypothetical protein